MPGASARYSCLHAPVETVTPPRRQKKAIPFRFPGFRKSWESSISIASFFLTNSNPLRWASSWGNDRERFRKFREGEERNKFSLFTFRFSILLYSLTGSGYSTPKVSTVTFFMTWGMRGLSL